MAEWSFTKHPASVGESYFEHMGNAFSFGLRMLGAGLACLIHGILPFLFTKTGSTMVTVLHRQMTLRRTKDWKVPLDHHKFSAKQLTDEVRSPQNSR
jgi:hypothetical protein